MQLGQIARYTRPCELRDLWYNTHLKNEVDVYSVNDMEILRLDGRSELCFGCFQARANQYLSGVQLDEETIV